MSELQRIAHLVMDEAIGMFARTEPCQWVALLIVSMITAIVIVQTSNYRE